MTTFPNNLFFYKKEFLQEKTVEQTLLYIKKLQTFNKNLNPNNYTIIKDDNYDTFNDYAYKFDIKVEDKIIGNIMLKINVKPDNTILLNIGMIINKEHRGRGICKNVFVDWVKNLLNDGYIVLFENILNIEAYNCYIKLAEKYDHSETYRNFYRKPPPPNPFANQAEVEGAALEEAAATPLPPTTPHEAEEVAVVDDSHAHKSAKAHPRKPPPPNPFANNVESGGRNSRRLTKKRRLIKIKKPTKRRRTTKRRIPIKRRRHTKRRTPTKVRPTKKEDELIL